MFSGSLVAVVTPMRSDGRVDFEAWARLVDFHLQNGTSGIVVAGTTGESATLRDSELRELTERACEQARGTHCDRRRRGVRAAPPRPVERVGWLSELPVDGFLIVTPAYQQADTGRAVPAFRGRRRNGSQADYSV